MTSSRAEARKANLRSVPRRPHASTGAVTRGFPNLEFAVLRAVASCAAILVPAQLRMVKATRTARKANLGSVPRRPMKSAVCDRRGDTALPESGVCCPARCGHPVQRILVPAALRVGQGEEDGPRENESGVCPPGGGYFPLAEKLSSDYDGGQQ